MNLRRFARVGCGLRFLFEGFEIQRFFTFEFYARAFEECFDHFSDAFLHFRTDGALADKNRKAMQIFGMLAAKLDVLDDFDQNFVPTLFESRPAYATSSARATASAAVMAARATVLRVRSSPGSAEEAREGQASSVASRAAHDATRATLGRDMARSLTPSFPGRAWERGKAPNFPLCCPADPPV